ncbi:MAG: cytochrome c maturation protein CcmE [Anaerolineae bacterium]
MASRTRFALVGVLIVAAVAYLLISSTGSTAQFFLTVDELRAMDLSGVSRRVTVSGAVLGDTIIYDSSLPRVTFTIAQVPADPQEVERAGGLAAVLHAAAYDPDAARLEVVYDGVKPDLLTNEAQAILRGRMGADGRFYADDLLLKCPSRYEEAVPTQAAGA